MSNTAVNVTSDTGVDSPKRKAGRPVEANSRIAQCKALYITLATQGKSRKEILEAFEGIGLKAGSAAVYYHEAKNAAKESGFTPPVLVTVPASSLQPQTV